MGHLLKRKKRMQRFKEIGDSTYIDQSKLHKACFQHNMAYGDFKYLSRRTASDKVLRDKALLNIRNIMDIKEVLLHWFTNF